MDTLITNARVRTFDPASPWAEAVGIQDGRIAYVGSGVDAPMAARRIDAGGRLLTPGIIDSHNHLLLGFDEDAVSLEGAPDLGEVRRRIAEFAGRRGDLDWICAENAVYSVVEGRRPNAADLDGITDRPIFITTYDQHSVWLNRTALALLGIAGGTDIPWGRPERDEVTGEPTGWVTDFYTSAMTEAGLAALQADIPMYSPQRRYRKLQSSMRMATALGITTVVEPQVPLAELPLFERALAEGVLTSRVIAALFHPVGADGAFRQRLRDAVDGAADHPMLRLGPVKLYADDVIEPHTALMLEDYANRPGVRGRPSYPGRELVNVLGELDRMGFQTHTHATGDAGIRLTLDAIEQAAHDERHPRSPARNRARRMPPSRRPAPVPCAGRDRGDAAQALLARPGGRHLDGQCRRAAVESRLAVPQPAGFRCDGGLLQRLAGGRDGPTGRALLRGDPCRAGRLGPLDAGRTRRSGSRSAGVHRAWCARLARRGRPGPDLDWSTGGSGGVVE